MDRNNLEANLRIRYINAMHELQVDEESLLSMHVRVMEAAVRRIGEPEMPQPIAKSKRNDKNCFHDDCQYPDCSCPVMGNDAISSIATLVITASDGGITRTWLDGLWQDLGAGTYNLRLDVLDK